MHRDMHRMEQLARGARRSSSQPAPRFGSNGEDVTDAIRTPEISDARLQGFGDSGRAPRDGGEAARDGGAGPAW